MARWRFNGHVEDDFDDEDFLVDETYTGFEKIKPKKKFEEDTKQTKKKSSVKHQKRPDKN